MIERGGGRTSGQTDWHLMDLNSMWACLQDHDTTNHWKQVAGWRKVCDLAQIHLGRLQEYRRGLAEAWPPETSAASGTYLSQLDDLIAKVRHTHDAAAANYTALSAATQAIGTTRAELRKLHEEYAVKLKQKQAYEATAADPKAIMGNRVVDAPVTDGELERLNVQARAMMFNLSGELQQAQATLQKPPPPPRRIGHQPNDPDAYSPSSPGPVIPPVVAVPMTPATTATAVASKTPPSGLMPVQSSTGVGPVLGGTGSLLTPGIANPAPPGLGASQSAPPTASPSLLPGISTTPTGGLISRTPTNIRPPTGAESPTPRPIPPTASRSMPPGGLIGGVPGSSVNQPGPIQNSPRRVNPVGGVIGGGGAGTAPSGGAGSRPGSGRGLLPTAGIPTGGAPGLTSHHGIKSNATRWTDRGPAGHNVVSWDPDHPWETDKGVAPVVLPPEDEGPINPGPAIGINR